MKKRVIWLLCILIEALAGEVRSPVKVRRLSLPYQNSTITSSSSSSSSSSSPPPPPPPLPSSSTSSLSSASSSNFYSLSTKTPSTRPASDSVTNSTTAIVTPPVIGPTISTTFEGCVDSVVTFVGRAPETVYVTVDGFYEVTVSNINATLTAPTILETPAQPCQTTIVPDTSFVSSSWINVSGSPAQASESGTIDGFGPSTTMTPPASAQTSAKASFPPAPSSQQPPVAPTDTPSHQQFIHTSTVYVTKKTPVPVVHPATAPPVTFALPKTDTFPTTTADQNNGRTTDGGAAGNPNLDSSSNQPKDSSSDVAFPTDNGINRLSLAASEARGLASIIASVINSPFVAPAPHTTADGTDSVIIPATTTIAGVLVVIGSSNIQLGTQTVALPISSPETVLAASQTFTIRSDEIEGPSTTFKFPNRPDRTATITQSSSTVTTAGVTFTIGPTVAIISGTTYRVGYGAPPTTITVDGQTVAIGSEGVAVSGAPLTTFVPPMTIAGEFEIVVIGRLTISVDQTEAAISGTTYSIGPGAPITTVSYTGAILTIGPGGVTLPSTIIRPTSVPIITATPASAPISSISQTSTGRAAASSSSSSSEDPGHHNVAVSVRIYNILAWIACLLPIFVSWM